MNKKVDRLLAAALRNDFLSFVQKAFATLEPGREFVMVPYIQYLVDLLIAVWEGREKSISINLPPRHLKSFIISVAFVAWVLGRDPRKQFMCLSHNEDLARSLSIKCRDIIESDWYREVFPRTQLRADVNRVDEFKTTLGGGRQAHAFNPSVMGHGADFIIIDDPQTPRDVASPTERENSRSTYDSAVSNRHKDRRTGVIINVTQRLHVDDLTAHLEMKGCKTIALPLVAVEREVLQLTTGTWTREVGDVLNPTMFPPEEIEKLMSPMHLFESQYQQRPLRESGAIIDLGWFPRFSDPPPKGGDHVLSWDTAETAGGTGSYSVCLVFYVYERACYLVDVFRKRLGYRDLLEAAIALDDRIQPLAILVEEAASGKALIESLNDKRKGKRSACVPIKTGGQSKIERLQGQIVKLQSGLVHLPNQKPWLADLVDEFGSFPNGRHSDQVDALSQFLGWFNEGFPPKPRRIISSSGNPSSYRLPKFHPQRDPRSPGSRRFG
jgi:predicted phage terminase large subunit-like protein